MLWSQYKLVTIRRTEFLCKEITGILNIANRNSDFLTLQTSEFQRKFRPESSESNTELEFRLQWGSQKLEPKIGIPNQGLGTGSHPSWSNLLHFNLFLVHFYGVVESY